MQIKFGLYLKPNNFIFKTNFFRFGQLHHFEMVKLFKYNK